MKFTREIIFNDSKEFLTSRNDEERIIKVKDVFNTIENDANHKGLVCTIGGAGKSTEIEEFDWFEFDNGNYTSSFCIDYRHDIKTNTVFMIAKETFTKWN